MIGVNPAGVVQVSRQRRQGAARRLVGPVSRQTSVFFPPPGLHLLLRRCGLLGQPQRRPERNVL